MFFTFCLELNMYSHYQINDDIIIMLDLNSVKYQFHISSECIKWKHRWYNITLKHNSPNFKHCSSCPCITQKIKKLCLLWDFKRKSHQTRHDSTHTKWTFLAVTISIIQCTFLWTKQHHCWVSNTFFLLT